MVCVVDIRGGEIEFLQGVEVSVGERLFPQYVDKATICGKTHEAAKKCVAKQELSTSDIRGAFTFSCGINAILGGADGMQDVSGQDGLRPRLRAALRNDRWARAGPRAVTRRRSHACSPRLPVNRAARLSDTAIFSDIFKKRESSRAFCTVLGSQTPAFARPASDL